MFEIEKSLDTPITQKTTGCPKKNVTFVRLWVLTLGGVFLGVKNDSENFGNKKKYRVYFLFPKF